MIFPTPFLEKALARRAQQEAVDARLQVTAPHEWLLVSALGVALVALLVYVLFGRVESSVSFDAVLIEPGNRIDVVVDASGVVVDVLARVGDAVERGQPIALVRVPQSPPPAGGGGQAAEAPGNPGDAGSRGGGFATRQVLAPQGGEVATLVLVVGQRADANDLAARIRVPAAGPPAALAFVTREDAARLAPGMAAQVSLHVPGEDGIQTLPAQVESVSPRTAPLPRWMTELGVEPPSRAHLVRAALTQPGQAAVEDGAGGTLRVVLGDRSLMSLLFGNAGG